MGFSFEIFLTVFPKLIHGIWITIVLLVVSGVIGNLLAVPVALARVSRNPALWIPSYVYIYLMRGTPLLVQIYLLYYGLGEVFGKTPAIRSSFLWPYLRDGFWYVILALSLNTAGYSGEILRGAIQGVPHGEIEAGRAFGMSKWLIVRRITLPRAIRISLPTFSGETILLLKATALASTVTIYDVLGAAESIWKVSFRTYESLLPAAVVYIVLVFILTRIFNLVERLLNKDRLQPRSVGLATATPISAIEPPIAGTAPEK
jgi:polar amino acid transport system permease protein